MAIFTYHLILKFPKFLNSCKSLRNISKPSPKYPNIPKNPTFQKFHHTAQILNFPFTHSNNPISSKTTPLTLLPHPIPLKTSQSPIHLHHKILQNSKPYQPNSLNRTQIPLLFILNLAQISLQPIQSSSIRKNFQVKFLPLAIFKCAPSKV